MRGVGLYLHQIERISALVEVPELVHAHQIKDVDRAPQTRVAGVLIDHVHTVVADKRPAHRAATTLVGEPALVVIHLESELVGQKPHDHLLHAERPTERTHHAGLLARVAHDVRLRPLISRHPHVRHVDADRVKPARRHTRASLNRVDHAGLEHRGGGVVRLHGVKDRVIKPLDADTPRAQLGAGERLGQPEPDVRLEHTGRATRRRRELPPVAHTGEGTTG